MRFAEQRPLRAELNVTQLIDVVLLLLFFFMLSTSFVMQPGIAIDLPEGTTQGHRTKQDLQVLMTAAGDVYVQERRVSIAGVDAAIAAAIEKIRAAGGADTQIVLVVKADKNVKHGDVVSVMDSARGRGIEQLTIATRPAEQDKGRR
ncbi:MAG: biopolymer transporter ExbD [Candidatus Schekmanbacteria bacterium]|nr:biopolymer transporter ExbD [Candidatus Schekmanbacteria bacterium]